MKVICLNKICFLVENLFLLLWRHTRVPPFLLSSLALSFVAVCLGWPFNIYFCVYKTTIDHLHSSVSYTTCCDDVLQSITDAGWVLCNHHPIIVVFLFVYCLLLCCVEELQHFVYFVSYFCEIHFFCSWKFVSCQARFPPSAN